MAIGKIPLSELQLVKLQWLKSRSIKKQGPNPSTSSYTTSVVNFYNATGSLARFENKNILFYFEKTL
jgi:hypothetical protein